MNPVAHEKALPVAIALTLATGTAPLTAQEGIGLELEEIIVTATRIERSLQEVPVAVSAVTGQSLEQNFVGGIENLAEVVPSLTFTQSSNDLNSRVQIRGIGTGVFSSAVEPSVSFVLDGVVLGRQSQGLQDLVDIDRVEVLRGPQSTLFGKNASAGVISVVTKDPSYETEGMFEVLAAEGGEQHYKGAISGPLSEIASARLTGFFKERDGHIDNLADGRELNGFESQGLRGKLMIEPSDELTFRFIADYRETDNDCCQLQYRDLSTALIPAQAAAVAQALGDVRPGKENTKTNAGSDVFNESEQWGVSGQVDWVLSSGHTLTSITAYREFDFNNNIDVDGTPGEAGTPGVVQLNLNAGDTRLEQFTQEVRLSSPAESDVSYVVGAYAFLLDLDRNFQRRLSPFVGGLGQAIFQSGEFDGTVETTNLSLFGELTYPLTDRLSVIAGARYIDEELEYTAFRDPSRTLVEGDFAFTNAQGNPADIDGSTDDSTVTGRVGLSYEFNADINAYATYSRGYKGKAFNVAATVQQDAEPIDAEEVDAFEVGLKARLFDRRLQINSAFFYSKYDNFQAQVALPGELVAILVNAGEVESSGFETEFTALLSEGFTLSGGLTYTDAEIDEFPQGQCYPGQTEAQGCVGGLQDLAGGELQNAPELKYSLNGRYQTALGASAWDGYVQLGYVWQDDVQFSLNQDPLTIQEDYGIANLSFGLLDQQERYQINFFVRNLFDESYANNIFRDALVTGAVAHYIPREAERFFGGSFRVSF